MDLKKLPIRLIISVAVGIAIGMVLSVITHEILYLAGVFPALGKEMFETKPFIISLIYHSIYALIAAIFTANIAREKAKKAAFILGSKEAIMWLLGTFLLWHHAAPWYNISKAVLGIPIAVLGGNIYRWYKKRKEQRLLQPR